MGFTDVIFCPLLANDLAQILLEMLEQEPERAVPRGQPGVPEQVRVRRARWRDSFGLDDSLITPTSVQQGGLTAARSPNLTLRYG